MRRAGVLAAYKPRQEAAAGVHGPGEKRNSGAWHELALCQMRGSTGVRPDAHAPQGSHMRNPARFRNVRMDASRHSAERRGREADRCRAAAKAARLRVPRRRPFRPGASSASAKGGDRARDFAKAARVFTDAVFRPVRAAFHGGGHIATCTGNSFRRRARPSLLQGQCQHP